MRKLNKDILLALARYYHNITARHNQVIREGLAMIAPYLSFSMNCSEVEPAIDSRKSENLKAIDDLCVKYGWNVSAIAGTFWFRRYTNKAQTRVLTIKCNGSNYLDGGERSMKRVKSQEASQPIT